MQELNFEARVKLGACSVRELFEFCGNSENDKLQEQLQEFGHDANTLDTYKGMMQNETLLMRASGAGNTRGVTILLNAGANPAKQDINGRTALHHTALEMSNRSAVGLDYAEHQAVAQLLLNENKALSSIEDGQQKIASHYVEHLGVKL